MQHGTETLEDVLTKTRSTSQHCDATRAISLTKSLRSFTQRNAALTWSYFFWALNWCFCMLRGNGCWWCSEQTGERLRKHRFALCGQALCSRFCRVLLPLVMTIKDLSGHDNSVCSMGRGGMLQEKNNLWENLYFCKCTDDNFLISWKYVVY